MSKYERRKYSMSAKETNDEIHVGKHNDSDWCSILMTTNDENNGEITIRSEIMAEQLHFMLGQMLGKS